MVESCAQRAQTATDARPGGRLADPEAMRNFLVAQLLDDAKGHRIAVRPGKRAKLAGDGAAQPGEAGELDDSERLLRLERGNLDADALQRPTLGASLALVPGEHVAGDPEQPRREIVVGCSAEALAAGERLRERLRGQVERRLGVIRATREKDQNRASVGPVDLSEEGRVTNARP